jgi:hypothetical protein
MNLVETKLEDGKWGKNDRGQYTALANQQDVDFGCT